MVLLSGSASAKTFDRIPDLADLVSRPIKGTYILTCDRMKAEAEAGGFRVVSGSGRTRLDRFETLKLVLMVRQLKDYDKIATKLLVHICIEDDTDYTIVSGRNTPIPREVEKDPDIMSDGERSFIPQKTRP